MIQQKLISSPRRPDVTFCRNGHIAVRARVARLLEIKPGDALNITVDHGEFLLYVIHDTIGKYEAQCRHSKKKCSYLYANSVSLCRSLLDTLGIDSDRASFFTGSPVESGGQTLLPIITRNPILK